MVGRGGEAKAGPADPLRPCAMVVPDFELICEIMLVSEGFLEARLLARKFITLYTLCRELLSKQVCDNVLGPQSWGRQGLQTQVARTPPRQPGGASTHPSGRRASIPAPPPARSRPPAPALHSQDHYDWGLRAIKSVLVVAGSLKRGDPSRAEDQVLMRALRDFNIPKIVTDDLPVFMGLIGDLFPAMDVPRKRDLNFEKVGTARVTPVTCLSGRYHTGVVVTSASRQWPHTHGSLCPEERPEATGCLSSPSCNSGGIGRGSGGCFGQTHSPHGVLGSTHGRARKHPHGQGRCSLLVSPLGRGLPRAARRAQRPVPTRLPQVIKQSIVELKLQAEDSFVLKVVQLEELLQVRHSVFVIGNAGSGKSQVHAHPGTQPSATRVEGCQGPGRKL